MILLLVNFKKGIYQMHIIIKFFIFVIFGDCHVWLGIVDPPCSLPWYMEAQGQGFEEAWKTAGLTGGQGIASTLQN